MNIFNINARISVVEHFLSSVFSRINYMVNYCPPESDYCLSVRKQIPILEKIITSLDLVSVYGPYWKTWPPNSIGGPENLGCPAPFNVEILRRVTVHGTGKPIICKAC